MTSILSTDHPRLPDWVVPIFATLVVIAFNFVASQIFNKLKNQASQVPPKLVALLVWVLLTAIVFDKRILPEAGNSLNSKLKLPAMLVDNVNALYDRVHIPSWVRFALWGMASVLLFNKEDTVKINEENTLQKGTLNNTIASTGPKVDEALRVADGATVQHGFQQLQQGMTAAKVKPTSLTPSLTTDSVNDLGLDQLDMPKSKMPEIVWRKKKPLEVGRPHAASVFCTNKSLALSEKEQTYELFRAGWLVNDETPDRRAATPSQRQAISLGILPHLGTSKRIIGETLSSSDLKETKWIIREADKERQEILPKEASLFLKEINHYGSIVAVKRVRGDIVYGRIESNEKLQPVEDWDATYVKKWMLSTDLSHHKVLVDALAGRRMSTILNKEKVNAILDLKNVSNNSLIRDPLHMVVGNQFQNEIIKPDRP
jgi:hypothetical protein